MDSGKGRGKGGEEDCDAEEVEDGLFELRRTVGMRVEGKMTGRAMDIPEMGSERGVGGSGSARRMGRRIFSALTHRQIDQNRGSNPR
eukprot:757239-Hanusia_phi.AAC.2